MKKATVSTKSIIYSLSTTNIHVYKLILMLREHVMLLKTSDELIN